MNRKLFWVGILVLLSVVLAGCGSAPASGGPSPEPAAPSAEPAAPAASDAEYVFGMVLVGPINDGGWNQAHYDSAKYVEAKVPNTRFIYIDKVNPADRPNVQVEQAVEELISQGAQFVITNSAEFADGTSLAAESHPDVYFIHASGDKVLSGEAPPNVHNLMGRMEYGKMMAGCAAALQSESGRIAYLGALIDPETRRLVNATYLGARHCWETYRGQPADSLAFKVTWIGFWFNIPGVTLDPTKVANDFINEGYDVIVSGIDTTEGIVEANKATEAGKTVWAVPYDFREACAQGEAVCLGVPFFNWGPDYLRIIESARNGSWEQGWEWVGPNWENLNDIDSSMIGFVDGPALTAENAASLNEFKQALAGGLNLFSGPLNYQDGSTFVAEDATASDEQVWYTEQLLAGIDGQSAP
ncbi:MAG: BMP family ABC transporter substrate-binding protein [Oscillochloris sp.]|nr:BMP family ABC transporter substrate-binding protein [Oscillochloris sp.]